MDISFGALERANRGTLLIDEVSEYHLIPSQSTESTNWSKI